MSINSAHRSNVTVYSLRFDEERPSHHDSGNEGLITSTLTMKIILVISNN